MKSLAIFAAFVWAIGTSSHPAMARSTNPVPMPRLIHKHGRDTMRVDGKLYLILGAQVNNCRDWPSMLGKVWHAVTDIDANIARDT